MDDVDKDGRLTGSDAVGFFERSGLPRDQLAKVWAFADTSRRGYLDFEAFRKALELVSIAQQVGEVSLEEYQRRSGNGETVQPPHLVGMAVSQAPRKFSPYYQASPRAESPTVMAASPTADARKPAGHFYGGKGAGAPQPLAVPHGVSMSARGPFSKFQDTQYKHDTMFSSKVGSKQEAKVTSKKARGPMTTKDVTSITDGLRRVYFDKVGFCATGVGICMLILSFIIGLLFMFDGFYITHCYFVCEFVYLMYSHARIALMLCTPVLMTTDTTSGGIV